MLITLQGNPMLGSLSHGAPCLTERHVPCTKFFTRVFCPSHSFNSSYARLIFVVKMSNTQRDNSACISRSEERSPHHPWALSIRILTLHTSNRSDGMGGTSVQKLVRGTSSAMGHAWNFDRHSIEITIKYIRITSGIHLIPSASPPAYTSFHQHHIQLQHNLYPPIYFTYYQKPHND